MSEATTGAGRSAPPAATEPERLAVGFACLLRRSGLDVPPDATIAYAQALGAVGVLERGAVYWAGRATLIHRPEDLAAYDKSFERFWLGHETVSLTSEVEPEPLTLVIDDPEAAELPAPAEEEPDGRQVHLRYSATEVLREKDFASCSAAELAEAERLMASLRIAGARRRTRRLRPAHGRGPRLDLRRTVRRSLRTAGEPVRRAWLEPGERPRRVVLLCDVSGSMEPYARALLRFLHVAVTARGRVEAFTIGTRLTRVTRELSQHDPDAAMAKAAEVVQDWSGGTRLGEALRQFNDRWGVPGLARSAVVVILSDGWDRGDPEVLVAEMARLARVAHRVVWVNPLKATPGYEPLVRGMAAALPYVDEFLEGHSLVSLEALAEAVRC